MSQISVCWIVTFSWITGSQRPLGTSQWFVQSLPFATSGLSRTHQWHHRFVHHYWWRHQPQRLSSSTETCVTGMDGRDGGARKEQSFFWWRGKHSWSGYRFYYTFAHCFCHFKNRYAKVVWSMATLVDNQWICICLSNAKTVVGSYCSVSSCHFCSFEFL